MLVAKLFAGKKAALGSILLLVFTAMCLDSPQTLVTHENSSAPDILIGNYNPQFLQHSSAQNPLFILLQDQQIGEVPFILEVQLNENTTSWAVFNQGSWTHGVGENQAVLLNGEILRKEISIATYAEGFRGKPEVEETHTVNVTYFNATHI